MTEDEVTIAMHFYNSEDKRTIGYLLQYRKGGYIETPEALSHAC